MPDPVMKQSLASIANATPLSNIAQKNLVEVQTAKACVETAVLADNNGLKVNLPKVCDKYVQQKVESTITFPTPKSSKDQKDQDGAGPGNK